MATEIGAAFNASLAAAEPKAGTRRTGSAQVQVGADGAPVKNSTRAQESPSATTQTVTELASQVQRVFRDIELNVDPQNGEVVVRVRDRQTGEVVRQIPAEEMLRLARFMRELQEEQGQSMPGLVAPGHEGFLLHTRA